MIPFILCWVSITTALTQELSELSFPQVTLSLSKMQYNTLKKSTGSKIELKNAIMTVDGDTLALKDVHLRGNHTLYYQRKSLSIDLDKSFKLSIAGQKTSLKKIHLLNLAMDKNLWHNRWAYLILSQLGLFPSVHSYCTFSINDESQGIYLLVEKPQHATDELKSPYTIRRGPNHVIDNDYVETKSRSEERVYRKNYFSLYETGNLKGESLYNQLNNSLNLDLYFKWMAFNYLIMNGDYADELFLYINPETKKYDIAAWDYDDLFMISPHEGRVERNKELTDRLIFSLEDDLDRKIAADDFVYSKYLESLSEMLAICNDEMLTRIAEQVLAELTSLSKNAVNCEASRYLDKEPFSMDDARHDILKSTEFLKSRREYILGMLNKN